MILRPEPGASETAARARELGLKTDVLPLFRVEPVDWRAHDPAEFDGLLLTSANALRHGGEKLDRMRGLDVHCIGEATARQAREAGYSVRSVGHGGINELLESLPHGLRLLHLCGSHRRMADNPAQAIVAVPVYRSVELPVPDRFAAVDGAVAMLHSPRAASLLAARVEQAGLPRHTIALTAISKAAAEAAGCGWERLSIAQTPTDAALLALAARLCNKAG